MVNLDDTAAGPICADPMATAAKEIRRVARKTSAAGRSATLAKIIEADIIPRLLLANGRSGPNSGETAVALDVDDEDIDAFAGMMVRLDLAQANMIVSSALTRGVALETIMLALLAPTAQRLGAMWTDDLCTFTDVTVGLCALQNLLRAYVSNEENAVVTPPNDGSALLAAPPGEQHTFGVLILETFFRRAGWDVVGMPLATNQDILSAVSRRRFAVAGFSLSRMAGLNGLRDLIDAVRAKALNSKLVVLVGGQVFNDNPGLFRAVGADLTACDAQQAVIASQQQLWSIVQTH